MKNQIEEVKTVLGLDEQDILNNASSKIDCIGNLLIWFGNDINEESENPCILGELLCGVAADIRKVTHSQKPEKSVQFWTEKYKGSEKLIGVMREAERAKDIIIETLKDESNTLRIYNDQLKLKLGGGGHDQG